MGHWDATTLGNDGALDAIAGFLRMRDSAKIRARLVGAFSAPEGGADVYDEGEAPYVLAVAELVAGAVGEPHRMLPDGAPRWLDAYHWLLSPLVERATAAVQLAARSPYARMWVHDSGNAEFSAAAADLLARLARGTPRPQPTAKVRFLRRVAELTRADGWRLRGRESTLFRAVDGGEQRVLFSLLGKHGLWTSTLSFRLAWWRPQELVQVASGFPAHARRSCLLHRFPAREAYHPSGNIWRLQLYRPGVDVPPTEALRARGLRPADVLNPNETVFAAAEQAVSMIRTVGEPWFTEYPDFASLRPIAERGDPAELAKLCPIGSTRNWIGVAWLFEPDWGARLLERYRERTARQSASVAQKEREVLDRIEAAMAGWG